ncbi:hypothetical protein MMC20_004572 [Loxospora ochrophaea]|nr:hypothetical protein [Loxospora ochrophaea]
MEGIFQEVDVQTQAVLFEWHSLDHVDPSLSYILPKTTEVSGDGVTKNTAYDYFHLNSIDKNSEGDYLISSRHTNCIYKISGNNGSIVWRLGGKQSSFHMKNFNFSSQHDARYLSTNSTTTVISFFDNAWNGFTGSSSYSAGKIIALDNTTMVAKEMMEYKAPDTAGLASASQGNLQMLPNGNVFIGWGSAAYVSESTASGKPAYFAHFATTDALQYRSYRFNFTSTPLTTPALYTYAHNSSAPTTFYVSWNGATEVASWTFYASTWAGNLTVVGNSRKNGFETVVKMGSFYAWTIAEAVAANGTRLRNSSMIRTFVPSSTLAQACSDIQCPLVDGSSIEPEVLAATFPPPSPPPTPSAVASSSSASSSSLSSSSVAVTCPTPSSDASPMLWMQHSNGLWVFSGLSMVWLVQ